MSKYDDDVIALNMDTSLVGAAKREKRKPLHGQYVNDINAVLTPDQQKSWAAANAARLERLRAARAGAKPSASAAENEQGIWRDLFPQSPARNASGSDAGEHKDANGERHVVS